MSTFMANPFFRFKNFTVFHDKCAMKVGTDAVLLGTWLDISDSEKVLDIGTGTGLISLILAQRSNYHFIIDAIDIDKNAIEQAVGNIANSPYQNIRCKNIALLDMDEARKYDLIVSNPPYFKQSLHSPDKQRTLARHTDSLLIEDLLKKALSLLTERGRIALIYPYDEKTVLLKLANKFSLNIARIVNVYPTPTASPKRILIEYANYPITTIESNLIIEVDRHVYSDDFVALVQDFYLNL